MSSYGDKPCLNITDSCVSQMKSLWEKNEKYKHLKVQVDSGGCSGFSYNLEMTDNEDKKDM